MLIPGDAVTAAAQAFTLVRVFLPMPRQKFFDEDAATGIEKFKLELHLSQKVSNAAKFDAF